MGKEVISSKIDSDWKIDFERLYPDKKLSTEIRDLLYSNYPLNQDKMSIKTKIRELAKERARLNNQKTILERAIDDNLFLINKYQNIAEIDSYINNIEINYTCFKKDFSLLDIVDKRVKIKAIQDIINKYFKILSQLDKDKYEKHTKEITQIKYELEELSKELGDSE